MVYSLEFTAAIIKTVRYWQSDSYMDQNRAENPETDSHKHANLIIDKGAKQLKKRKTTFLLNMVLKKLNIYGGKKNKLQPKSHSLCKN